MSSIPCNGSVPANYAPIHWGRVRWFDFTKKFGFIEPVDGVSEDVFVHKNDLLTRKGKPGQLYTGEYVEYRLETVDDQQKGRAKSVTGIGGGPLLCEAGKVTFESYSREQMLPEEPPTEDTPLSL
jgi:cold shock CspA family protein